MVDAPITFIDINGINTAQAIAGDGEPILMLHGWGANINLVWPLAARLVARGYRVYVPDLPGFGQTAEPAEAWSVHHYANFVIAYLDYYNLDRVYLFGHSFGGRLGLVLGAKESKRIIKMALADSAGVHSKSPLLVQVRLTAYKTVRDGLYRIGVRGLADGLRRWYSARYGSADYRQVSGVMRETFVNVVNEDLLPYAAQVRLPTLLLWGDQDEDTPLWQGELLEKTIPDAGLVVYAGAGHYSYLERLVDTARTLNYFFKQE